MKNEKMNMDGTAVKNQKPKVRTGEKSTRSASKGNAKKSASKSVEKSKENRKKLQAGPQGKLRLKAMSSSRSNRPPRAAAARQEKEGTGRRHPG